MFSGFAPRIAKHKLQSIQSTIQNPRVSADNKVRLVTLYALRYERQTNNALPVLFDLLTAAGNVPAEKLSIIPQVLAYHHSLLSPSSGGFPDIFESTSFLSGARQRFKGLQGVENVYTQHSPRMSTTLDNLLKGKLKETQYPFLDGASTHAPMHSPGIQAPSTLRDRPQDVIVFIIGGATYEETKCVADINESTPGVRVILGGTCVHNSKSFLDEVAGALNNWPEPRASTVEGRLRREIRR